mgnify:CR=1 FL=1
MITLFIVFFLRLTVVRGTQAAMYKERTSGKCGDSGGGWGYITSAAACEAGAAALGWGDTTADTKTSSNWPPGCWYYISVELYFNSQNPNIDCDSQFKCLCTLTCPPGTYLIFPVGHAVGTYANGTASCDSCGFGKYNEQVGQTSCKTCGTGKYNDQIGQTSEASCESCGTGKYNGQQGQSSCIDNSVNGTPCPLGEYQDESGQTSCKICATGQYNAQEGQPSCKTCPDGQLQFQRGQSSCDSCTSSSNNTWVNSVANVQQSVEKLLGGEAENFAVTGTLKVGTLRIRNVTLQDYITSVCNCTRL